MKYGVHFKGGIDFVEGIGRGQYLGDKFGQFPAKKMRFWAKLWPLQAKFALFLAGNCPKFVPKVLPPSYALNKVYAPFEVYTILHLGLQTDPGAIGQCFA